jgi:hypothetical protein
MFFEFLKEALEVGGKLYSSNCVVKPAGVKRVGKL